MAWLSPLLPHFGSAVLEGQSDATNALRMYWAIEEAHESPFTWSHDTLSGAPEGIPRPTAPEFVSPVQSGFVWAMKPLVGRIAALNLFIALGFLLTAFAMFLLLSRFGFGLPASILGGYVVAFNPWMFERAYAGAPAFLHGWAFVLLLYTLVRVREQRTLRRAAVAGAAYGLTFSIAAYFGLLATAIVAGFALVDLAHATSVADRLWTFSLLAVMGLVTAVFLAPGATAFLINRSTVVRALNNPLEQLDRLAASPLSYVLPSARHPLFGSLGDQLRPEDPLNEKVLFFGFVTLALAVIGVIRLGRSRGRTRELLMLVSVMAPIALVASLPRSFELFGVRIPTPAYAIGEVTSFYRVYARFGYVFGLALAILAAWAIAQLPRTVRGQTVAVLALVVVAFELLVGSVHAYRIDAAPDYDRWLAAQPRGIVAHYPMPTDKREALALAGNELTFQPLSRQPLYAILAAGTGGTREDAIRILTRHLGAAVTPGVLAAEGVRYVVVHQDVYRAQGESVPRIPRTLELIQKFGDVRIYRLRASPTSVGEALDREAPSIALLQGLQPSTVEYTEAGFNPSEEYRPGEQWRWMIQAGQLEVTNPNAAPARFRIEGLAFSSNVARRLELTDSQDRVLGSLTIQRYTVPLRFGPFSLPQGESRLFLKASPAPEPLGDGRMGSVYLSPLKIHTLPDYSNTLRRS